MVMQHKWAWPFNEPVNAERMGLKDYHLVIKQPMARRLPQPLVPRRRNAPVAGRAR